METQQAELLEKLGVDSFDDIGELTDSAGMAEAAKQFETKLKRMERQLGEAQQSADAANGKYKDSLKTGLVAEALGAHKFLEKDVVSQFVANSLVWEGDDLLFKTDDGNLVSVKDGVSGIAKSRPELLESTGAGGAGIRASNAGSNSELSMTRTEFEGLSPAKQMEAAKAGVTLQ